MANPAPRFTGFPYGLDAPGLDMLAQTNPLSLPQTTTKNIFTITGGPIWVQCIFGVVTTLVGAVANATKLTYVDALTSTATDICATADINALVAGAFYNLVNGFGTGAVITGTAGIVIAGSVLATAPMSCYMQPGLIRVNCAGSDGGTGRIQWYMNYRPMSQGFQTLAGATAAGAPAAMVVVTSPLS